MLFRSDVGAYIRVLINATTSSPGTTTVNTSTATSAALAMVASGTSQVFGTCGKSGAVGPSQDDCYSKYRQSGTQVGYTDPLSLSVTNGIQYWKVPVSGTYSITAIGASGSLPGSWTTGSYGAQVSGNIYLTAGSILKILVEIGRAHV